MRGLGDDSLTSSRGAFTDNRAQFLDIEKFGKFHAVAEVPEAVMTGLATSKPFFIVGRQLDGGDSLLISLVIDE